MANPLEQFILLAKNLKDAALVSLINQMLEAPGVYSFGEFLELPCVKQLSTGPNQEYSRLLDLFAYGTYHDYKANKDALPALSEAQKNKLRHLTIASLAANTQCIPYSVLQQALGVASVRQLEDVLIEAVYLDVIRGKLDQCKQQLEVETCISRDMRYENTGRLVHTLNEWCVSCENVCCAIELQVHRVKQSRERHHQAQQQIQTEVSNICQMLTAAASSSTSMSSQTPEQKKSPDGTKLALKSQARANVPAPQNTTPHANKQQ
ncbi:COP9 signalosome complex subunit 7b-like [Trichomycterus rosablanca]|uniref:COP9 signalosome complex subunit 7b-like n=1 Tax=Trichomycterus rosablanca TaxID=2290929 RepID=UPI002F35C3C0